MPILILGHDCLSVHTPNGSGSIQLFSYHFYESFVTSRP